MGHGQTRKIPLDCGRVLRLSRELILLATQSQTRGDQGKTERRIASLYTLYDMHLLEPEHVCDCPFKSMMPVPSSRPGMLAADRSVRKAH